MQPGTFFWHGYLWVDMFFILSGFVLAETYSSLFSRGFTFANYKTFLGRRIARVYPLYFVMTILAAILIKINYLDIPEVTRFLPTLGINLLAIQSWVLLPTFAAAGWSISTEWAAYVLFPLLAWAALFSRNWLSVMFGASSFFGLVALALAHVHYRTGADDVGLLAYAYFASPAPVLKCVAEFSIGLFAWRSARHPRIMTFLESNPVCWGIAIATAGLLCLRDSDLLLVILFALIVMSTSRDRPAVARILGSRLPHLLGVWSYALYLVHSYFEDMLSPVSAWLRDHNIMYPGIVALLLTMFLAVCSAALVYRFVEMPARLVARRLFEAKPLGAKSAATSG